MSNETALPPWTDDALEFAQSLVGQARSVALRWFRHGPHIEMKPDASPVTEADQGVERFLRAEIVRRYPDHSLLGEEFGVQGDQSGALWSIDPIDGTRSFITGTPQWGCLLALLHARQSVFGIIDIPVTSERWVGVRGRGAWLNGERCHTRLQQDLGKALLYATSPDEFAGVERAAFEHLSKKVHLRRFGGDCYSYGLLASGLIDLVVEAGLKPYDYLALVPVVTEAGGVMTDWEGKPLGVGSDGRVLAAANAALHAQALQALSEGMSA